MQRTKNENRPQNDYIQYVGLLNGLLKNVRRLVGNRIRYGARGGFGCVDGCGGTT